MIIQVNTTNIESYGANISYMISILNELKSLKTNESVTLILKEINSSNCLIILLLKLLQCYYGSRMNIIIEANKITEDYLSNILFSEDGFKPDLIASGQIKEEIERFKNLSNIPLINFPSSHSVINQAAIATQLLNGISSYFKQKLNLNANLTSAISYLLSEATDNIFEHANSTRSYLITHLHNDAQVLDIVIADHGITIAGSYKKIDRLYSSVDA